MDSTQKVYYCALRCASACAPWYDKLHQRKEIGCSLKHFSDTESLNNENAINRHITNKPENYL